ncbi:MAG: hypothetical protein RLZZ69_2146, partial [Cyanobacteriota bacterium]
MKIGTQLTAGAFGIGAIVLANLGVIFLKSSESDAQIINLSGVVRGATQRVVKLELANSHSDEEDHATDKKTIKPTVSHTQTDELIQKTDQLIEGLLKGDLELGIPQVTDTAYLATMEEAKKQWQSIEKLIIQV